MNKRAFTKASAVVFAALTSLVFFASPATAESINVTVGDCEADGTRQVIFEVDSFSPEVQWIVDGKAWGRPTKADGQTAFVKGDDLAHTVEAVTVPEGNLIGKLEIVVPSCGANQVTTTTATSAPTTEATTTTRNADLFPAWVTGIAADDPDGGLVVRSGPGTDTAQLGTLENGTGVIALGNPREEQWVEILSPVKGWVSSAYLSNEAPTNSGTTAPTTPTTEPDTATTGSEGATESTTSLVETDDDPFANDTTDDGTAVDDTSVDQDRDGGTDAAAPPSSLPATANEAQSDGGGLPIGLLLGGVGLVALAGVGFFVAKSRNSGDDGAGDAASGAAAAKTTGEAAAAAAPATVGAAASASAKPQNATAALNAATRTRLPDLPESSEPAFTPKTPARGSTTPKRRKSTSAPAADSAATSTGDEAWDPSKLAAAVAAAKVRPDPEGLRSDTPAGDASADETPTAVDAAPNAATTTETAPSPAPAAEAPKRPSGMPKRKRTTD